MSIIKRLEKGEPLTYQELDNNFSVLLDMINSLEIPEISNVLTSFDTTQGLSANQGRVLAEYIIDIQGKLSSDDPALDTLQKIVNYLKAFSDAVPSHVREISSTDIDNWEEAHSWGDHSEAGYLTESTSDNKGATLDIDAELLADYEKSTIVTYINNLDPSYVKEDIDSTFVRILKEDKVVKAFVLLNTTKGSIGLNDKKITADDLQVIDGKTYHKVNNFSTYRGYGVLHADADPNDGSIYVFGRFSAYKGQPVNNFIKLKPNGELDENFITTGVNAVQYYTQALHVNADGTVFLVGWFTTYNGTSANRIVKILPTGEIDTSFNYGSGFNNGVTGVYVDEVEQKIYVLGYFTTYNGVSATRIVKINWDGSRDTSFVVGGGFNNIPLSLAFIGDHIYVSGYFTWFNGTSVSHLVKLSKATGAIDTSFVSKGFNIGIQHGLYLANHQNKLLCHGGFTTYGGQPHRRLLRLNSDGSVDTTFDVGEGFTRPVANDTPSGSAWIKWLHIEPDDSIYICLDDTVMLHKGKFMGSVVKISPTGAILNNYTRVNVRNQGLFKVGNTFYLSVINSFDPEGYGSPDGNQTCSLSPIDFSRGVEYEYRGYKLLDNGRIISSANNALNTTNEETSFISRTETKGVIKDYLNHTLSSVVNKLTPIITSSDGSVVIDSTTTSGTIDLSVSGGSEGGRFGVVGEDDTMDSDRTVTGSNNTLNLNSMNLHMISENSSNYTEYEMSNGMTSLVVQQKVGGEYKGLGSIYLNQDGASIAYNDWSGDIESLCEVSATRYGIDFNIDDDRIVVPWGISGTLPMSVNGVFADENGNISIEAGGSGGVQSVTGTAVDNTDPLNPVINIPEGGGESAFRIELDTNSNKNYISAQSTTGNVLTNGSDNLIMSSNSTVDGGSSRNIIVGNGSVNESYQNILCGWGLTANSAFFNLIGGTDNLINEGDSNLIIGHNNEALGDIWYSVVGGQLNEINGYVQSSIIMGEGSVVTDTYNSFVMGGAHEIGTGYESIFVGNGIIETEDRTANGGRNVGFGYGHEIAGGYNAAIGYWHKLQDYFTTAVGVSATTDGLISPRFLVGIGDVDNSYPYTFSPKNGFAVLQSGEVIAPHLTNELIASSNPQVLVTRAYLEANSEGGTSYDDTTLVQRITDVESDVAELNTNKANDSDVVKSISLNGGTPVLPVDGNVDLVVEGGGGTSLLPVVTEHVIHMPQTRGGVVDGMTTSYYALGNVIMHVLKPNLDIDYSLTTETILMPNTLIIENIPSNIDYRLEITNYKGHQAVGTEDTYEVIQKPYCLGNALTMIFSDVNKKIETYPLTPELKAEVLTWNKSLSDWSDRTTWKPVLDEGYFRAWVEVYDNSTDYNYFQAQSITIDGEPIEVDEYGGLNEVIFGVGVPTTIVVTWPDTIERTYVITPAEEFGGISLFYNNDPYDTW